MGKYGDSISKRFEHTRIIEGYCLICGSYGRLSQDHVPPKGAITITKVEQRHVTEVMGLHASKVKGVLSPNGSKFKTVCHDCNNRHLGGNDEEVARVCRSLTVKIKDYFVCADNPFSTIRTDANVKKFARAMIGHILAATSVSECKEAPKDTPYFNPLKNFVLGDDSAIESSHDIYYWFYPYRKHVSAKFAGFRNEGHLAMISILSFFPVSFMVTKKNEGTFPSHSRQLRLSDNELILDLSSKGYALSEFPFHGLEGDQMMLLNDYQAIVSYPIGQ